MAELALAWLVFPALLAALALGLGLLVERAAGVSVPGALLVPIGFALLVVVARLPAHWDATAELATPAVLAAGVAGLVAGRSRLRALRPDPWCAGASLVLFGVLAAPVVLSGEATFAGYTILSDIAAHLLLVDHVVEYGRNLAPLAPSSSEFTIAAYVTSGYPLGAHAALGAVRPLVGEDAAWLFTPYMAFACTMLAPAFWCLTAPLGLRRPARAAIAVAAALPHLVYASYLQGSLKEIVVLAAVACTAAALVPLSGAGPVRARHALLPAVPAAAAVLSLGLGILPWLAVILFIALAALDLERGPALRAATLRQAGAFAAAGAALALPALLESGEYVAATRRLASQKGDLGNLFRPLDPLQAFGVWPAGDHMIDPLWPGLTNVLIAGVAAAALAGAWLLGRRRAWIAGAYALASALGCAYSLRGGTPWTDTKALMLASPGIMLLAAAGAAALAGRPRTRVAGLLLGAAIGAGLLVTTALAYRDVNLAPRERLAELDRISRGLEGRGPTLFTDVDDLAKRFLRHAAAEVESDLKRDAVRLRDRTYAAHGEQVDLDRLRLDRVLGFRAIVLRRGPLTSRPPAAYRLTESGGFYEVWERQRAPRVVRHHPLGGIRAPAQVASCGVVQAMVAAARRAGGRLAYVERPAVVVMDLLPGALPNGWRNVGYSDGVLTARPGTATRRLDLPAAGRWTLWVEGSFGRPLEVLVDGRRAGRLPAELGFRRQYRRAGELGLERGAHEVTLRLEPGSPVAPGTGGRIRRWIGALVAAPAGSTARRLETIDPSRARALCGRSLDWIEVVQ